MRTSLHAWSQPYVVLGVVALASVVSHWSLIWHHPVPDFDTDTIIGQAPEVCGNPWIVKGMGDSAHPLGNAFIQQYICLWNGSSTVTTNQGWALLLIVIVALVALLLLVVARRTGAGPLAAAIAIGYVGISPSLRTISSRTEEDWIGLSLFLFVTVLVLGYHRAEHRLRLRLVGVAVATLVLAVWHFQYLLVLAFGLTPWALLALVRPGLVGTTRRRAIELGLAMAVPAGALLGLLFGTGYAVRTPYHKLYLSIFNPDYWEGIVHWCRNYATYSSRWLTGWLDNDGMAERLFAAPTAWPFVVLGVVALALVVLLVLATRNSVLVAVTFGCLLLPFLFEPHNAERWDPTAIIIALALAHGTRAQTAPETSTGKHTETATERTAEESSDGATRTDARTAPVGSAVRGAHVAEEPRGAGARPSA